ncbi:MAG: hypothetical protein QOE22_236 [Candidatus Parcubacteria bacterium]|jgi:hypothetical protein|nr:hypothetical protein [Candidatus Parcubacteria bacterium]
MNLITIAYAQSADTNTATGIINWFIGLINTALIPLIFALALLMFLFGVFKFFFSTGANAEESRKEGRKFVMWGILAFAVMICIWGLVKLLILTVPSLNDQTRPNLPCFSTNCNSTGSGSSGGSPMFGGPVPTPGGVPVPDPVPDPGPGLPPIY